jgi:hypothetical protein
MDDSMIHAPIPSWAPFFTGEQSAIFLALVEAEIQQHAAEVEVGDGVIFATLTGGEQHSLGLKNLAQRCHQHPEAEWVAVITEHVASVLAAQTDAEQLDERQFSEVEPLLKLKLYADDLPPDAKLVREPVAEGIAAVLTLDLPHTVRSVSADKAESWGKATEELLAIGLANALAEPFAHTVAEGGEGVPIHLIEGNSFFVATRALRLEDWVPLDHPNGALVVIPHRHAVLFHVIEGMTVLGAVNALMVCARGMFREGPGSISPEIYWWRAGQLTLLPSAEDASTGALTFSPPPDFVHCLDRLAQSPS